MRVWTRMRTMFFESFAIGSSRLLGGRAGLAYLLAQRFAGIADSLVLIRIGRTQRADIRGDLPHQLLVVTTQDEMCLLIDLQVDALGQQHFDRMRIAQRECRNFAFDVGAVSDAGISNSRVNPPDTP